MLLILTKPDQTNRFHRGWDRSTLGCTEFPYCFRVAKDIHDIVQVDLLHMHARIHSRKDGTAQGGKFSQ